MEELGDDSEGLVEDDDSGQLDRGFLGAGGHVREETEWRRWGAGEWLIVVGCGRGIALFDVLLEGWDGSEGRQCMGNGVGGLEPGRTVMGV